MATSRTLILMRHAEAGGAARDHDRPLTSAGTAQAAAAGDWIRGDLPAVDAIICSTSLRTRQTLTAARVSGTTTFADEIYGGGIDDILGQIALLPDSVRTVLVIGHAPGIPSVAFELATVAQLARDDDGAAPDDENGPVQADLDVLRSFAASAVAVLSTDAAWAELGERGATLVTVRHPDR